MQHLASLLLVGAMGVAAHPSGHGHGRFHNRAVGDVIVATIDGVAVSWTQSADYGAAATPTPMIKSDNVAAAKVAVAAEPVTTASSSAAAVPTEASSSSSSSTSSAAATASATVSSGSGSGVTAYTDFTTYCAGQAAKNKRATLAQIAYTGNVGSTYNCNLMLVASETVAAEYDNIVKFTGATEDMYCDVWNKIGVDGGINGFFGAKTVSFTLPAGQTQYLAIDANSQGGAACFPGNSTSSVTKTATGLIAGTWLEFDVENSSNNGYSGADASCIVAQANSLTVPGLQICTADNSQCSTISTGAASVVNAYDNGLVDADGIGIITSGKLNIVVDVGFT